MEEKVSSSGRYATLYFLSLYCALAVRWGETNSFPSTLSFSVIFKLTIQKRLEEVSLS